MRGTSFKAPRCPVRITRGSLRMDSDTPPPAARAVPGSQQLGTSAGVKTSPDPRCFRARCEPGMARAPLSASSLMRAVFRMHPLVPLEDRPPKPLNEAVPITFAAHPPASSMCWALQRLHSAVSTTHGKPLKWFRSVFAVFTPLKRGVNESSTFNHLGLGQVLKN